ncbi:tellurite resistance/C4-dicarboxylate transporter family protein [Rhodococcus sp. C3V]|uniref:tellurite resistance/C4-dicarboxylate transporter family protein n=1 Tax=Rhodococcus sp. C3V TaxID=3034165 RepID=UPI0023E2279B|nr:tellurite resistance/C4-dicarboxylate transporter family protein [Rhodococcus sp. C3V]MDF3320087.1 tellurite resistance/C4-dicarboxylate transporter family protein [Rhodococcus sp. C3V]
MSGDHHARSTAGRTLEIIPPGAGAAAMSSGIVSVALHLIGLEAFSLVWLVIGTAVWLVLAVVFASRLVDDRARWIDEADTPPALTGVAATTVLGTRFALFDWSLVGFTALAIAVLAWIVLIPAVIRHWTSPTVGVHFLLCVATQGLAVLGATLAATTTAHWIAIPSAVAFVLGLAFYVLVLVRFSLNQLRVGAGDHWVFGGALAISTLAAGKLSAAAQAVGWPQGLHHFCQRLSVGLMVLVLGCYAVLLVCELVWPRLDYDVRRWSTAFPMGMTSAASLTVAATASATWLKPVGEVLVWPAVALCTVLLIASLRRLRAVSSPTPTVGT